MFAGALDLGVLAPALPAIARGFAVAPRDAAWIFTLYLFANVVAIPVMSKLSDTYGRRPIYSLCVGTFGAGSLLAIAAPNFTVFLVARAIQAVGAGGIFPVATAAIADRVPPERRGAALGMLGAIWGLAAIIGPNVGGVITHFFSWRWIFAANVPLALVVVLLAQRYVPRDAARVRGPLDLAGIGALSIGLLSAMIGLTRLDVRAISFGDGTVWFALALAAAALATLIPIERHAAEPVIAPQLFAGRQLALTYALEVAIGLLEGALFFIPAALVAAARVNYAVAGSISAVGALAFVAVIPLAGRALDRFGSRTVLLSGALLTALGLGLFAAWLAHLPLAVLAIAIAGVGFGALLGAPTRYIVTNEVPASLRASGVGLLSIFLIIGQILGGSLAGGIIGASIENVLGYRSAYAAFAAVALLTALGTLGLASRRAELQLRRLPPEPV